MSDERTGDEHATDEPADRRDAVGPDAADPADAAGPGRRRRRTAATGTEAAEPVTIDDDRFTSLSRRAVLTGGVLAAAGIVGFRSIDDMERIGGSPELLRAGYEFNEDLWRNLTDLDRLAPEFAFERSGMPIVNGRLGIRDDVDVDAWRLSVLDPAGEQLAELSIDDVRALPFTETIFEFKCIEGWSQVTAFGGVVFSDFLDAVAPAMRRHAYVGMATPSEEYYVAMDMQALLHPQTILAWEMQREPLTQGHGAPLRLATPLKYGIKNIRRPGTMQFTDEPPPDYWGERGYSDWVGL